ncbi:MAG: biotin/lipoyl-containing protein [Sulfobacillus sp.]
MRRFKVTVNGHSYEVEVEEEGERPTGARPAHSHAAQRHEQVAAPAAEGSGPVEQIVAPLPGTVLAVKVSAGQAVESGQVLLVLEAMKMENEIVAPRAGTVKELQARQGQAVNTGDPLLTIG